VTSPLASLRQWSRDDLSCRSEGGVVEHGRIFLNNSPCSVRRKSLLALDSLLPIGARLDQAGIDRKAFAADQALAEATLQDRLKDPPQKITFAETAAPVLRERGMIGNIAVEPEPTNTIYMRD
jgi:hypothetical protein